MGGSESGRKRIDLDSFKEELLDLLSQGKSHQALVNHLFTSHNVKITRQTLANSLHEWTNVKEEKTEDSPELRVEIANIYFSAYGIDDTTLLRILKQEGFTITLGGLISIRKKMNIYRRLSPLEPQKSAKELAELLNTEFEKGGILGYGRVHLATYFHQQRHIIPRYS
jgi:hypothetical protein